MQASLLGGPSWAPVCLPLSWRWLWVSVASHRCCGRGRCCGAVGPETTRSATATRTSTATAAVTQRHHTNNTSKQAVTASNVMHDWVILNRTTFCFTSRYTRVPLNSVLFYPNRLYGTRVCVFYPATHHRRDGGVCERSDDCTDLTNRATQRRATHIC